MGKLTSTASGSWPGISLIFFCCRSDFPFFPAERKGRAGRLPQHGIVGKGGEPARMPRGIGPGACTKSRLMTGLRRTAEPSSKPPALPQQSGGTALCPEECRRYRPPPIRRRPWSWSSRSTPSRPAIPAGVSFRSTKEPMDHHRLGGRAESPGFGSHFPEVLPQVRAQHGQVHLVAGDHRRAPSAPPAASDGRPTPGTSHR